MPLPAGFQGFEHLQDVFRRVYNRRVRDSFADTNIGDSDLDISTARSSLRTACMILDSDSAPIMLLRLFLFYIVLREGRDLWPAIYGEIIYGGEVSREYKPQIMLYFLEDITDVESGYAPITAEIKFRLMSPDDETLSEADLQRYAGRIAAGFATGNGFVWRKGKGCFTYTDKPRGYQMKLYVRDKAEGRRIVSEVLQIQNHAPDWAKANYRENEEPSQAYPTVPRTVRILGKTRKLPRRLPIGEVRFQYSQIQIYPLPHPVMLVDRSKQFLNALISR